MFQGLPYVAVPLFVLACTQGPATPAAIDYDAGTSDGLAPPGPQPHTMRVSLIDHSLWTLLSPEEDPFDDRPETVECAADAVAAEVLSEEPAYGVDTGSCNYVTARQVTQEHVAVGETIVVRLWHFTLTAPNPAEAHAVVDVDGLRLLDRRVPIPTPGGLIKVDVPIDRAIAAGAPVYFHLHNHGENSWALVEISTGP